MRRFWNWLLWGLGILLFGGLVAYAARPAPPPEAEAGPPRGMFEWTDEAVYNIDEALALCQALEINRWYQEFAQPIDYEAVAAFVEALGAKGVRVYALVPGKDEGFEADAASLIALLAPIARYNAIVDAPYRLAGVMADVEPYIRPRWKEDPAAGAALYQACMESLYAWAQEQGLPLIACLPRHYDDQGLGGMLEAVIAHACDEAAIMNYGCGSEVEAIATEAALAAQYGKPLHCILEFQEVGKHGLVEEETYNNKGVAAAQAAWAQVDAAYPALSIVWDYHYAKPLQEMLARDAAAQAAPGE